MKKSLVLFAVVMIAAGMCGTVFSAPESVVKKLRMVDNNHVPQKVIVVMTSSTKNFCRDLFEVIKKINETENLPADEKIKLHIIPAVSDPIGQLGISQADAQKYLEVNSKFSSSDIWAQDCMELCSAQVGESPEFVPAVFDSNRGRGLAGLPKVLAEMWSLAYAKNPSTQMAHGDYGGNIEVTPFDDVLVCGNTITAPCKAFFEKMGYAGRFFNPDTSWLTVGHIDEYLSFIPTTHAPGGYSFVKADPAYALELLSVTPDEEFSNLGSYEGNFLKSVKQVLQAQKTDPLAGKGTQEGDFIDLNRKIGEIVENNVSALKNFIRKITNDPERDFGEVSWPNLYEGRNGNKPSGCCSYLPGVVNLLVLRNHLVVPACHLPTFDKKIEARFRSQGNIVHFVDDEPYHNSMGEIHCGTNVLRSVSKTVLKKEQVLAVQKLKKLFKNLHKD